MVSVFGTEMPFSSNCSLAFAALHYLFSLQKTAPLELGTVQSTAPKSQPNQTYHAKLALPGLSLVVIGSVLHVRLGGAGLGPGLPRTISLELGSWFADTTSEIAKDGLDISQSSGCIRCSVWS